MIVDKIKPPNKAKKPIPQIVNEIPKPKDKYFPFQELKIGKFKKWVRMPNRSGCFVSIALLAILLLLIFLIIKIIV